MNLRDRLERTAKKPGREGSPLLREKLELIVGDRTPAARGRERGRADAVRRIGGEVVSNASGSSVLVRSLYPAHYLHGGTELSSIFSGFAALRAAGCQEHFLSSLPDVERLLFLDTETTGLAGGAGTYAFLIGAGFFRGSKFHIHQFFMSDFNEESSMLIEFRNLLIEAEGLVTFNGKAFDLPLLEGRCVINRNTGFPGKLPHLDLLFVSRRLWSGLFPDCRLKTLEEEILGAPRHDDIESSLIPSCYFNFVRKGELSMMDTIFSHNRLDILTLVALASRIASRIADPFQQKGVELARLGKLHHLAGNRTLGAQCLETAIMENIRGDERRNAQMHLSLHYRREGRHDEAAAIWNAMKDDEYLATPFPYMELAKYYEHRKKDPARALGLILELQRRFPPGDYKGRQALECRRRRLADKVARM